jgi:hypothetical protein
MAQDLCTVVRDSKLNLIDILFCESADNANGRRLAGFQRHPNDHQKTGGARK